MWAEPFPFLVDCGERHWSLSLSVAATFSLSLLIVTVGNTWYWTNHRYQFKHHTYNWPLQYLKFLEIHENINKIIVKWVLFQVYLFPQNMGFFMKVGNIILMLKLSISNYLGLGVFQISNFNNKLKNENKLCNWRFPLFVDRI